MNRSWMQEKSMEEKKTGNERYEVQDGRFLGQMANERLEKNNQKCGWSE